jgi:beta-lactamase class A
MGQLIDHMRLAQALLGMVRALQFQQVGDTQSPTGQVTQFPSLDLAVVAFPTHRAPVWANVLFSRDFPQGVVAAIGGDAGAVRNIHYLADQTDAAKNSLAWFPDSCWDDLSWKTLAGQGETRFVAPYPASLIKLMVAVGVARVVDAGSHAWESDWAYAGRHKTIAQWTESMIVASNNDATSAMVALLHAAGLIQDADGAQVNHLEHWFAALGLDTLRLANTRPDGGWRNADGAGVGQLQMTAWDTVRLLWTLMDDVAPPPWLGARATPVLSAQSRTRLWGWLADQGLHEILSSTLIAGVPGWRAGIPAQLPSRWVLADGAVQIEDKRFPPDVRAANAQSTAWFAHKTGTTDNYASDAGLVTGMGSKPRKYLIALTSSLGRRYVPHADCATDWRIPQLGAAIDAWMQQHLERTELPEK